MKKKIVSLVIVTLLLFTVIPVIPVSAQEDFCFFEIGGLSTVRQPANNISVPVVVAHTCEVLDSFMISKTEILNNDGVIIRSEAVNQSLQAIGEIPEWVWTLSMQEIEADPALYAEYCEVMSKLYENGYFSSFTLDLSEITNDLVVGNNYSIQVKVTVLHNGDTVELTRTHEFAYQPSLPQFAYQPPLPLLYQSGGWYSGDAHLHSCYSYPECYPCSNPFGWATIQAIAEDARDFDLDWIILTDHSYWLDENEWVQERQKCSDENTADFTCMCGEELSVYDGGFLDGSAHYLCHGISQFIPNTGVNPLLPVPDLVPDTPTAQDAIANVNDQGGAGFIAHPHSWPFSWNRWDLSGYTGLEIWNGDWGGEDAMALDKWVELLLAGSHVFGIANSDSHQGIASGFTVGYEPPVWNYLFLYSLTENEIIHALKNGHAVMTNGPLVVFDITNESGDKAIIGDGIGGLTFTLNMEWVSTSEFGNIDWIRVILGVLGEDNETVIYNFDPDNLTGTRAIDLTDKVSQESDFYIRVEASAGNSEKKVYTNPIWVYHHPSEGFEWGSDGGSLDTGESSVDWTVTEIGNGTVEIDDKAVDPTAQAHWGTKSAKFDGVWDGWVNFDVARASYPEYCPKWRGFWLMTSGVLYNVSLGGPKTTTGDGKHFICVRVQGGGRLQYRYGGLWWVDTVFTLKANTWYLIEFRNIDWDAATYDIYVDDKPVKIGAPMNSGTDYNGLTYEWITSYGTDDSECAGQGAFWIDDIVEPEELLEGFEWGNDGGSLDTGESSVDWTVTEIGAGSVEIDDKAVDPTAQAHWGTKSAKFDGVWDGYVNFDVARASYPDYRPEWRGFWVMTSGAYGTTLGGPKTTTGDGQNFICVRVEIGGRLQYRYDGYWWQYTNPQFTLSPYRWYFIEFRNIDWDAATYDIYVDDKPVKIGAPMNSGTDYNGLTYEGITSYGTDDSECAGQGAFWIDDIVEPEESAVVVETYVKDNTETWQAADSAPGPYIPSTQDPVIFKFTIHNTGNVALIGVNLTDTDMATFYTDEACTNSTSFPTTLAVNETQTFYGKLDWLAGQQENEATAAGKPPVGNNVADNDPAYYFGPAPNIDVEKYVKDNSGTWQDADSATGPNIPSTQALVVFKFTIQNTGDVALTDVNLTDTDMATFYTDEGCMTPASFPTTLAVDETKTYYGKLAWLAGQQEDEATVDGTLTAGIDVNDKDKAYYFGSTLSVIEDFEWGNDGDSLGTDGGDVDWTVYTPGTSVAEIDTAQKHTGTRSARIYKDGASTAVYAYHSLLQPSYIGFYVRKDGNACAEFRNGGGSNAIRVRINSAEVLQYYDTVWRTVHTLSPNTWYLIEFRNIDWNAATYDIYVDGVRRAQGAKMRYGALYVGNLFFGSWSESGNFWIDDVVKHVVREDFEWGSDGTSLDVEPPLGNVDWTVTEVGAGSVEIDESQHHWGTKSARFYGVWDGYVNFDVARASYPEYRPKWRGFWLRMSQLGGPKTTTGDGEHFICVRVQVGGQLQYRYGGFWWEYAGFTISPDRWYFIEFRNIDWDAATYDIYVDGNCVKGGAPMNSGTDYNGLTYEGITSYGTDDSECAGQGAFWIDDINDSLY